MKDRNLNSKTTTRQIFWIDADNISQYKQKVQRYDNQKVEQFEKDADLYHRIIEYYIKHHPNPPNKIPVSTFPAISK